MMIYRTSFYDKTPKQLETFILNSGFSREYVLDVIQYCEGEAFNKSDEKLTLLELCEKYCEQIKESIWYDLLEI